MSEDVMPHWSADTVIRYEFYETNVEETSVQSFLKTSLAVRK